MVNYADIQRHLIGGEKFRYSFSVSDTWLCPIVQLALRFGYKEVCKGRAPLGVIILYHNSGKIQRYDFGLFLS